MPVRNESRSAHASKAVETNTDGGTTLAKSRAKTAGEIGRTARADEKQTFLTRLERSRSTLFHGSD